MALFNELGMAATAGIEASFQVLAQIDLGFGPSDTAGLEFVQGRKVVEAMMNSAGWRDVPYLLRDRAFFSAYVADMQTRITSYNVCYTKLLRLQSAAVEHRAPVG